MHPFPQSVIPAVYSHLNAQVAFFNELPLALSRSLQQACRLNMQLGQTLIEEAFLVGLYMVPTKRATATLSAAEKPRADQQCLSQPTVGAQVDLPRMTEQHVQASSHTALTLADEVAAAAAEQTNKSIREQEGIVKVFRDPFEQDGTHGGKEDIEYENDLQSDGNDAHVRVQTDGPDGIISVAGYMQGTPARRPVDKNPNHMH
ncbi:MAG: phasin family protein [Massilia sp.]|nr:phasin family protein [Massilia sp.]